MLWDVANAAPRAELTWPSGPARFVAFSPDGKTLATGGEEESLRLWDVASGTLRATFRGHADAIDWVAFSPDGKTVATASRDATAKLWDAPAARPEALKPTP
jgi:WD40 repeat protein